MLLKGGKVYLKGELRDNMDILLKDGLVEKISKNLDGDSWIDVSGMEIYPGFIDPVSSYGCLDLNFRVKDNNELQEAIMPDLEIKYSFNPHEIIMEELYKTGITAIGASPGNLNVIGGDISCYNTYQEEVRDYLIKDGVGLKGCVTDTVKRHFKGLNKLPTTKMGIFKLLGDWIEENKESDSISGEVIRGRKPFFVRANSSTEIRALLEVFKDTKTHLVIVGAFGFDRCIDELLAYKNISLIIGEQNNLTIKKYYNTDLEKLNKLIDAGVKVSFTLSGEYSPEGKVKYLWSGIDIFRSGVSASRVIDMMTINPAKMLGVEDLLGSIEVGKKADLLVFNKNPIEHYDSNLKYVFIDGKEIYREEI